LRRVINATGIVLHTNLGRAPVVDFAMPTYCNLEYSIETGQRGSRMAGLASQITSLTGAQAALAVNNNAAAVLLALSTLCSGREVIVSRGELVEIGGSFRVPEVMAAGGATLREVGTTNVTTLADYEKAINADTAAILKVHTSNYRIEGYTAEASLSDLASLASKRGIPLIYDLGGGALIDLSKNEPKVQNLVKHADVLCFSGDKLLGGPQAGIIVGRAALIDQMRNHPLYRALRMDKLTIAALSATLELYEDDKINEIPTLAMLMATLEQLLVKAQALLVMLPDWVGEVVPVMSQAGGGSLPGEDFPSYAIAINPAYEEHLRKWDVPIIGRIHKDRLLLDVRTIDEMDFVEIAAAIGSLHE